MLRLISQLILRISSPKFLGKLATFYYLHLHHGEQKDIYKLATWLKILNIQTVLDIGAHAGQSTLAYHHALPQAQIYSFEPNREVFKILETRTQSLPNTRIFNVALGAENRQDTLNTNVFSASSSILPLDQLHKDLYVHALETHPQTIQVRRLDDVASEQQFKAPILFKMDVQGYEKYVLAGAEKTIESVAMVVAEVCYQPLFQGQTTFDELYQYLIARGFVYKGSFGEVSRDDETGMTMYTNELFVRKTFENTHPLNKE